MSEEDHLTKVRMALPRFILRGVSGASFGKTFPIYRATVLGRHSECDLVLDGEGLSRRHAELSVEGARLVIKDLGSANGTYINDKRVEEGDVKIGDELRLDTVRFLVQSPDGRSELDVGSQPVSPPAQIRWMPWAVGGTLALAAVVLLLVFAGVI